MGKSDRRELTAQLERLARQFEETRERIERIDAAPIQAENDEDRQFRSALLAELSALADELTRVADACGSAQGTPRYSTWVDSWLLLRATASAIDAKRS